MFFPLYLGLVEGKLEEVVMRYGGGYLDSSMYIMRVPKKKVKRGHCGGLGEILGTRLGSQKQNKNKIERKG